MTSITNHFPLIHGKPQQAPSLRSTIVQKVALESFSELAVTLTIGCAVCSFTASSLGMSLVIGAAVIQTIVNTLIRCTSALAMYKKQQEGPHQEIYEAMACCSDVICPNIFILSTGINGQTLIHETGHAIAALKLYEKSDPLITIHPFQGGETSYWANRLSPLGKKIGREKSKLLMAASGPALSLFVSSILFGISTQIKEKHPQISSYLEGMAVMDFYLHAFYALSALWTSPLSKSHDFVVLSKFGIHPVAVAVTLAALPAFVLIKNISSTLKVCYKRF